MDPLDSAQDVVRCDLCEDNVVQNYCDFCHVNLCKPCIGEHISNVYYKHKIVPFHERKSTMMFPIFKTYSKEVTCQLQCKSSNISIRTKRRISKKHKGCHIINLEESFSSKRTDIERDTENTEKVIL